MMNVSLSKIGLMLSTTAALAFLGSVIVLHNKPMQAVLSPTFQSLSAVADQPVQADLAGKLMDQGQQRTYYLHTPPSYQPGNAMPLVLAFHGSGDQGKDMAAHSGLSQLADQEGFIVVYPDGINKKWNVSDSAPEDNVAFVHALIAHISQIRSIDHQRIYATGLSNGGILVQKLACEAPNEIAAFATVAASLPEQFRTHCQTQTPVSMLMINSTADDVVPWQGGQSPNIRIGRNLSIPSMPDVVNFWQQHNTCAGDAVVNKAVGDRVQETHYSNCWAGSEVNLLALKGAGHIWPGGAYGQSPFLDASKTIWDFFQRHPLSTATQSGSEKTG
jgi:polyhydroxybutyrate depolymerase